MIVWPSRSSGSRSSTAPRICDMSISMCTYVGVPSVRTMWSAPAASWIRSDSRSRPVGSTRSSSSCVPVSWNGIRPSPTSSSTRGSRSMPTHVDAAVGEGEGQRQADPAEPDDRDACRHRGETSALSGTWCRPRAHELPAEGGQEARVVVEVARQQPARLLRDPVGPLEPALLHPRRRLRDAPGVEVERGAHGAHHRHLEPVAHARHPLLLARHADAHPQHVGAVGVDLRAPPRPPRPARGRGTAASSRRRS